MTPKTTRRAARGVWRQLIVGQQKAKGATISRNPLKLLASPRGFELIPVIAARGKVFSVTRLRKSLGSKRH